METHTFIFDSDQFAEKLKDLLIDNGTSIEALCETLGINQSTLYRYLRSQREPGLEIIIALADFFSCTTDYLIGLDNENYETVFNKANFANRLKYIMKSKSIKKSDFIKAAGLPRSAVYSWLSGSSFPNVSSVVKTAGFFDCSVDFLLGRVD